MKTITRLVSHSQLANLSYNPCGTNNGLGNDKGCEYIVECNDFGCWEYGNDACVCDPLEGCPCEDDLPNVYAKQSAVVEDEKCTAYNPDEYTGDLNSPENILCLNDVTAAGNPLVVRYLNTQNEEVILSCNHVADDDGDIWCPEGYEYQPLSNRCEIEHQRCDIGSEGNLQNGCDEISVSAGNYKISCVKDELNYGAYDEICCYGYTLNGVELYQYNRELSGVRVY